MFSQRKLKDLKAKAVSDFIENGISKQESEIETAILSEYVFRLSKKDVFIDPDLKISEDKATTFNALAQRRIKERIPVQYLVNKAYFMGQEFYVDENVLIPRPETEILVEEVLNIADKDSKIIDIGTGSGCIAIMLAKKLNSLNITASDISEKALKIAKFNAKKLQIKAKIRFLSSNIFQNIDKSEKFDIIVSNPPYISIKEKENLQPEVSRHEPAQALFVEDDEGISFYEKLAEQAVSRLNPTGFLIVEIGIFQAKLVGKILKMNDFGRIKIIKDLAGIERIIVGKILK